MGNWSSCLSCFCWSPFGVFLVVFGLDSTFSFLAEGGLTTVSILFSDFISVGGVISCFISEPDVDPVEAIESKEVESNFDVSSFAFFLLDFLVVFLSFVVPLDLDFLDLLAFSSSLFSPFVAFDDFFLLIFSLLVFLSVDSGDFTPSVF